MRFRRCMRVRVCTHVYICNLNVLMQMVILSWKSIITTQYHKQRYYCNLKNRIEEEEEEYDHNWDL